MIYMMFTMLSLARTVRARNPGVYSDTQGAASLCPGLSAFALTGR